MSTVNSKEAWQRYKETEYERIESVLHMHGYTLDEEQPHLRGERFLMQAVTTESGKKLILLGTRTHDNLRVVIKGTSDPRGKDELRHEQTCRALLHRIDFAYDVFHSPQEVAYITESSLHISIQEYIEQDSTFLERPVAEQFAFALTSLKAQERVHATTHQHFKTIAKLFGTKNAHDYVHTFATFVTSVTSKTPEKHTLTHTLTQIEEILKTHATDIERYCGFLTHTDFVPHNFRIKDETLYLLDYSSLRFANKHEGWARFLNFMALYNPELERALVEYVEKNRAPEELQSLTAMRLYRLGELMFYYTNTLDKTDGDLQRLNEARVDFWHEVALAILEHRTLDSTVREAYIHTRDALRSHDEKKRQQGLH